MKKKVEVDVEGGSSLRVKVDDGRRKGTARWRWGEVDKVGVERRR